MEINQIVWLENIVEKLLWKHNVREEEVIEVFSNKPNYFWKEPGHRPKENVYAAYGKTDSNRYLSVFFVYTEDGRAIIVSAREMNQKERKKYAK